MKIVEDSCLRSAEEKCSGCVSGLKRVLNAPVFTAKLVAAEGRLGSTLSLITRILLLKKS